MRFVLALDQGTTSSRTILFDENGSRVASAQREFKQYYPRTGWVEHDPEEIWDSQRETLEEVLAEAEDRQEEEELEEEKVANLQEINEWGEKHHLSMGEVTSKAEAIGRMEADIESLLESSTSLATSSAESSTFSKVAFVADGEQIDMDDPEFWTKVIPELQQKDAELQRLREAVRPRIGHAAARAPTCEQRGRSPGRNALWLDQFNFLRTMAANTCTHWWDS